jgi:ABC-2 type transport system permease protein
MATRSPTLLLLRDELIGFAKSKVMLVLWVVLPVIAIAGYLLLPDGILESRGMSRSEMSATTFISFIMSGVAGTVAALMVAVDIVSERNRKVYELFVIRPIRPEAIIWAKFLAVFTCVAIACVVSLGLGLAIDAIRGAAFPEPMNLVKALISLVSGIALSCSVGVLFGVLARTILVAVILILYVGRNLAIIPMLPMYLGLVPNQFWLIMVISAALTAIVLAGASVMFRRAEL